MIQRKLKARCNHADCEEHLLIDTSREYNNYLLPLKATLRLVCKQCGAENISFVMGGVVMGKVKRGLS